MQLSEAITKYEKKLKEVEEGIAERGRATSIADQFVLGTLLSNKEEYSNLVEWLKELQERRNTEVGLFYEEKAKRQAEQS
jgi:hypothetical protein